MITIGLTGGIASGKTSVGRVLERLAVPLIDTDLVAREVVQPGTPSFHEIVQAFGCDVVEDGQLNRSLLANLVFSDPKCQHRLNEITHPRIYEKVQAQIRLHTERGFERTVVVVPLLFEAGWQNWLTRVWVVWVDAKTQLARLQVRDELNREDALRRISAQKDLDAKARLADVLIDNTATPEDTRRMTLNAWQAETRVKVYK